MNGEREGPLVQCGRTFREQEIEQVCETVRMYPKLTRKELTATLCEHLGWYTAGGGLKANACEKLLEKLRVEGRVQLPAKRMVRRKRRTIELTGRTRERPPVVGTVATLGPIRLEAVEGARGRLVDEYLQRYHPLGYRQPFGYRMRYLIEGQPGRLGCLLFAGAAKNLGAREQWIGWTEEQRLQRLAWLIGLNRHLIFPWVQVKNLSSHVLALVRRQVPQDWEKRWGYRPVLLETFVDPLTHVGSCYKAAGWTELGMSSGEGLVRPGRRYRTTPKKIFVTPLCRQFRSLLCADLPVPGGIR
jgi:hypothetical protein